MEHVQTDSPTAVPFDQAGEPDAILPRRLSRLDGREITPAPSTVRFAQALAFDDSWSAISEVRKRPLL